MYVTVRPDHSTVLNSAHQMTRKDDTVRTDNESLVRISIDRHAHGSLKHPTCTQVRLICVDRAEILCTQQVCIEGFLQSTDDAFEMTSQTTKATEGQRRLNSRGIAHLQDSWERRLYGASSKWKIISFETAKQAAIGAYALTCT